MTPEEFNLAPAAEAAELIAPTVAIDSFPTALVAQRPFADLDELLLAAQRQIATWTEADLDAALADHPRIGQRHTGSGASAEMSRGEQAGVDPSDTDTVARLAAGNAAYEERFGRIYLVRAAGRSATEMLTLLDERLTHDPETELAVTLQQLGEIALLRLKGLFS